MNGVLLETLHDYMIFLELKGEQLSIVQNSSFLFLTKMYFILYLIYHTRYTRYIYIYWSSCFDSRN